MSFWLPPPGGPDISEVVLFVKWKTYKWEDSRLLVFVVSTHLKGFLVKIKYVRVLVTYKVHIEHNIRKLQLSLPF